MASQSALLDRDALALLTPQEMARADNFAVAQGRSATALMLAAGRAVAEAIVKRWSPRSIAVLCGPGNNGGDGFVVARMLAEAGWRVRLGLLGERTALKGAAAHHAAAWSGGVEPLSPPLLEGADLVIDAIFGAGLARPVSGAAAELLAAVAASETPIVAIDVPSGLDGATGAVRGLAAAATLTVTFFRKKPGHLLLPGRRLCGEVLVADIGIPATALAALAPRSHENGPALWLDAYPWPKLGDHKYQRGHVLIAGGETMTGAARLAARAAGRIGAGLVTLAAPNAAWPIYAAALTSTIVRPVGDHADFVSLLADQRRNALLLGPGGGATPELRDKVLAALATHRSTVLDADALTIFGKARSALFGAIAGPCVLTPHEGEFTRIFDFEGDKLARARSAARQSNAVIVLKGSDTVIAAPDGRAVINANAPPELATGGTGDVLGGMIVGLMAQGMPAFAAAAAAVWLHGEAGKVVGPGLVAEDLPDALPRVLRRLRRLARDAGASAGTNDRLYREPS